MWKKILVVFSIILTLQCGYLLYPERKGQTGGQVDAGVLVLDILWFLPGIIPGVVALIVDYSTGCIYKSGSAIKTNKKEIIIRTALKKGERVNIKLFQSYERSSPINILSLKEGETRIILRGNTSREFHLLLEVNGETKGEWTLKKE